MHFWGKGIQQKEEHSLKYLFILIFNNYDLIYYVK